jgi:hypothetical protein
LPENRSPEPESLATETEIIRPPADFEATETEMIAPMTKLIAPEIKSHPTERSRIGTLPEIIGSAG